MKENKIYIILTKILNYIMMIMTFFIILHFIKISDYSKICTDILMYVSIYVPNVFSKTKYKLNDKYKFLYSLFIFLAQFLGSVINLYKYVWWFDIFTHFLSGILVAVLAIYILEKNKQNKLHGLIRFIYVMGFSSFVAIIWEVIEYTIDSSFNLNMQHSIDTGVGDTMIDMIIATLGSLITYFIIRKKNNNE